jgi:hypothetical protein
MAEGPEGSNKDFSFVPLPARSISAAFVCALRLSGVTACAYLTAALPDFLKSDNLASPNIACANVLETVQGGAPVIFSLTIAVAGDELTAQGTGQQALPLMYEGQQNGHPRFYVKQLDANICIPGLILENSLKDDGASLGRISRT